MYLLQPSPFNSNLLPITHQTIKSSDQVNNATEDYTHFSITNTILDLSQVDLAFSHDSHNKSRPASRHQTTYTEPHQEGSTASLTTVKLASHASEEFTMPSQRPSQLPPCPGPPPSRPLPPLPKRG
ncbi:hypothetical protein SCUP234_09271 [Seiridium cupressi]